MKDGAVFMVYLGRGGTVYMRYLGRDGTVFMVYLGRGGTVFMRYLGRYGTVFLGDSARTEEIVVLWRVLHCSVPADWPHKNCSGWLIDLIKTVPSRPRYHIKTVPSRPRYHKKTVPSRPRYLINLMLYCILCWYRGFSSAWLWPNIFFWPNLNPPLIPKICRLYLQHETW